MHLTMKNGSLYAEFLGEQICTLSIFSLLEWPQYFLAI
jgi:hypothetical protein